MDATSIMEYYYADEGEKLQRLVDGILVNFGGIQGKDRHDFYSIANEVFASAIKSYVDGAQSFKTYLRNCIANRVKTEISRRNAAKRTADIISMNAVVDEYGEECEIDVASDFNLEEDILSEESAKRIYSRLSHLGKKIVELRLQGKTDVEIKKILGITKSDLENELKKMKSSTMKTCEYKETTTAPVKESKGENTIMAIGISPDYRDEYYSVSELKDKIECGELLISHPNQRSDWAWNNDDISTLVATVLHGFRINPVIVCEETDSNGSILNWVVDGKQRITSLLHFAFPEEYEKPIKVSSRTEYTEIPYQVIIKDSEGRVIRDELGKPSYETRIFDIKGKTFADFPEQLQRSFLSYKVGATRYVNCDSDLISYHIRRYNKGRAMTKAQKANTYLSEKTASTCKKVSANHFFERLPDFTNAKTNGGAADFTVMSAIMLMNYPDNWVEEPNKMYAFYEENGDPSDFELLDEYLTRLDAVVDEDTEKLFTSKDAHFLIALFHEFVGMDHSDEEFNDFLRVFGTYLTGNVVVGNCSWDKMLNDKGENWRATRSKKYVAVRTEILERHMDDYLNGDFDGTDNNDECA